MQFDAPFGELNRKRRRVRPFFLAVLNCFVGDEPRVPAATQIFSPSMRPTPDVALILIRNAKRKSVQFDATGLREMENVFVAVVEKSRRIDRLEMAKRLGAAFDPYPALRVWVGIATGRSVERIEVRVERDGFDPVNRVLEHEQIAQRHDDFVRQHRVRRRGTDIEKKRAVRF